MMRGLLGVSLVRVVGRSMIPTLSDGDYVLLKRYGRFRKARTGDVVCIAHGGQPLLIKRLAARMDNGRFRLSGDGAASAPSADLGLAESREIVGRALLGLSGNRIRWIGSGSGSQ